MANNRYVDVNITRQTRTVSQQGFGLTLILSPEQNSPYKVYDGITGIGTDFGTSSETYKIASAIFAQSPSPQKVAVYGVQHSPIDEAVTELTDALSNLVRSNNDFYYLVSPFQTTAYMDALSDWAQANGKWYGASTADTSYTNTNNRTIILVHPEPDSYPAEALIGAVSPLQIGSVIWTFKTLAGITPAPYDSNTIDAIHANNAITYISEGGQNITTAGTSMSGEYIDDIQGVDYLTARLTEAVYGLLVRNAKIPFTDAGIALVASTVDTTLQREGVETGIIAADADGNAQYSVTVPSIADISEADRAARRLPGITFTGVQAGAVEEIVIDGTITLS